MNQSDPKFAAATKQYCKMMADGKGSKVALKATGLSHSQADRAWYISDLNPKKVTFDPKFATLPEAAQRVRVLEMRAAKLSWGHISLITGLTESRTQAVFSTTAGVAAEGTRSGKGGRFLAGEPRLYLGNRKGIGIEAPKPRAVDVTKLAADADKVKSVIPAKLATLKRSAVKRVAKQVAPKANPQPEVKVDAEAAA